MTWRDMEFAPGKYDDKGRRVLQGHPSTFEAEAKQLRARVAELRAENESLTDRYEESVKMYSELAYKYVSLSERVVNQVNRIADLEAALVKCVNRSDLPRDVEKIAFAALQKTRGRVMDSTALQQPTQQEGKP